ncbi:MAG: pyridoxamine 5'-phosphate oxidase family protein [Candidatus Omnitrophota bacterium]|nr:pyridoxamine 5'-phosphate oxidase family protein [Candidatus Omnitrophota bacterium]
MSNDELKGKILDVIKKYPVGSVGTMRDGKPWVRYMAMKVQDDLTLYTSSFASSRKAEQIKKNNNVNIVFGADNGNFSMPYVNIDGTAEILTDKDTKEKCWCGMLEQFFSGPDDPNYIVIKVTPRSAEYIGPGAHQPVVYKCNP